MAHECPDCGMTCFCNGDIDDLCLDIAENIFNCKHCDIDIETDDIEEEEEK